MTAKLAKCSNPVCACPVQADDAFCPTCGQPLTPIVGQASRLPLESEIAKVLPSTTTTAPESATTLDFTQELELPRLPRLETNSAPAAPAAEAPQHDDCPDLEVRYNNSCVFVLNMQSTFDFEIRPLADGLKGLFVEVRQSGQVIARETPMVLPRRGALISFGLNYTPRHTHAGKVSFTIVVGYRKEQQQRIYAAYRTHTIHSGKEDPRRVCESLVVEVKNNIQQGHAGDLRVDQSFNGLREALRERSSVALDKEFLDLINGQPFWTTLALAECASDEVPAFGAVPETARRANLVLRETGGATIHLLTHSQLRIGRARDCEIVARVCSPSGDELKPESMRLSRYHALLEWKENRCRLLDRGYYPDQAQWQPSSTGVWVDGKRIPSGGEFILGPGREYHLALSEPGGGDEPTFDLAARLWTTREVPILRPSCAETERAPDAPACLVLRRLHGPAIHFVLLRRAVSLGWVDARWSGACVCLRHNALTFSDSHTCDWLVPGRRLRSGVADFEALESPTRSKTT